MRFGNYETLQKVAGNNFLKTSNIIFITRILALTLLVIGISNPVIVSEVTQADSDYVLAVDSSSSMLSGDLDPNRLEASKRISKQFVSDLGNETKVGIVSFSGKANKETEMNSDIDKVKQSIDKIQIGSTAGTAIGDALSMSVSMLAGNSRPKTVVLITDGRNNAGSSVDDAVEIGIKQNVTVNTIGIGERNDSLSEFETVDGQNASRAVYPNLNTTQLSMISNRTGGKFVTASNETQLRNALINLEKSKSENDISRIFILLAAAVLLLEWLLGSTKYNVIP
jgi:Ca-activated chloride channel family protein